MSRNGRANVGQQLFVVPWLLNKVLRARADSFDDIVHGAVSGDHDDRQLGLTFFDLRQQLEATLAGKGEVEQNKVEVFQFQDVHALLAVIGHPDRVSL